jgi:hypothetical protein
MKTAVAAWMVASLLVTAESSAMERSRAPGGPPQVHVAPPPAPAAKPKGRIFAPLRAWTGRIFNRNTATPRTATTRVAAAVPAQRSTVESSTSTPAAAAPSQPEYRTVLGQRVVTGHSRGVADHGDVVYKTSSGGHNLVTRGSAASLMPPGIYRLTPQRPGQPPPPNVITYNSKEGAFYIHRVPISIFSDLPDLSQSRR